ncbi:MAG: hypothetical protein QOD95_2525 [Gammaproteobacteria bacterium]|jgi:hypothetical protein|nr:hypothetical protein [Gammaproteobacteria bacterium]
MTPAASRGFVLQTSFFKSQSRRQRHGNRAIALDDVEVIDANRFLFKSYLPGPSSRSSVCSVRMISGPPVRLIRMTLAMSFSCLTLPRRPAAHKAHGHYESATCLH